MSPLNLSLPSAFDRDTNCRHRGNIEPGCCHGPLLHLWQEGNHLGNCIHCTVVRSSSPKCCLPLKKHQLEGSDVLGTGQTLRSWESNSLLPFHHLLEPRSRPRLCRKDIGSYCISKTSCNKSLRLIPRCKLHSPLWHWEQHRRQCHSQSRLWCHQWPHPPANWIQSQPQIARTQPLGVSSDTPTTSTRRIVERCLSTTSSSWKSLMCDTEVSNFQCRFHT